MVNRARWFGAILALLLLWPAGAGALELKLEPDPVARGGAAALLVEGAPAGTRLTALFSGRPLVFVPSPRGLAGLFGADVMLKPGQYPLTVSWSLPRGKEEKRRLSLRVVDKDYGTRRLTFPRGQVELSRADLERHEREKAEVEKTLATVSPDRLWQGAFLRPVPGEVVSAFGRRTVVNEEPRRKPHTGVDLKAAAGQPIQSPAAGLVLLADFHFFAGGSVYLDHGQGLLTMFFHLSEIQVKPGQEVERGQVIGRVGATGRVSGPHLHYGLYLGGARIDPLAFQALTENLKIE